MLVLPTPLKHSDIQSSDRHRRLRQGALRGVMGGDPVVWSFTAPSLIQFAKIGRYFVLQHEPHSYRVVEPLGDSWRAL